MRRMELFSARNILWLAFVAWFCLLWDLSAGPPIVTHSVGRLPVDKILHFGYFFLGGIFLACAMLKTFSAAPRRALAAAFIALALIGIADEWHQMYNSRRQGGDVGDWMADATGGIAAVLVVGLIHGEFRRRTRPAAR
jgi:VanZ family protein